MHLFSENILILIKISPKFIPNSPISNIPALIHCVMAWRIAAIYIARWQAIVITNADAIHWRIYAALGGDELNHNIRYKFREH